MCDRYVARAGDVGGDDQVGRHVRNLRIVDVETSRNAGAGASPAAREKRAKIEVAADGRGGRSAAAALKRQHRHCPAQREHSRASHDIRAVGRAGREVQVADGIAEAVQVEHARTAHGCG